MGDLQGILIMQKDGNKKEEEWRALPFIKTYKSTDRIKKVKINDRKKTIPSSDESANLQSSDKRIKLKNNYLNDINSPGVVFSPNHKNKGSTIQPESILKAKQANNGNHLSLKYLTGSLIF